jgi:hypothetical protein
MKPNPRKQRDCLDAKIFFRASSKYRDAVNAICEKEQIDLSEMLRYLLESGLATYTFKGFPQIMRDRAKLLEHWKH